MQAGAGMSSPLAQWLPHLPASSGATGGRGGGGQGQADSQKLGKWPQEGQGTAWLDVTVITTAFWHTPNPGLPACGASTPGPCAPWAWTSAPVLSGTSLTGDFPTTAPPEPVPSASATQQHAPDWTGRGRVLPWGPPPKTQRACSSELPPLAFACSRRRSPPPHARPSLARPQERPCPRRGGAVDSHLDWAVSPRPRPRLGLYLFVEWSTKVLCPKYTLRPLQCRLHCPRSLQKFETRGWEAAWRADANFL